MKKRIIFVGSIAIVAIVMTVIGCAILYRPVVDTAPPGLLPINDTASVYQNATSAFDSIETAHMDISTVQQLIINGEVLTEKSQKSISYRGYNTDDLAVTCEETLSIGDATISIREAFVSGSAYVSIDGGNFSAPLSAQEYQSRFVPLALLTPSLYENILGFDNGSEYSLYFDNPTDMEAWAIVDGWNFAGAKGFAQIDHSGKLVCCTYSVTLTRGSYTMHVTTTVTPDYTQKELVLPEDIDTYTPISYLDGPRMLEKASCYLLHSNNISANYSDRIFCQAFGDERTKNISLYTAMDTDFIARIDTKTLLTNTGRVGDVVEHLHNELFVDGVYTISIDGGEPTENADLDLNAVQTYCKNQLVSTIMLPENIVGATATVADDSITITLTPDEDFVTQISTNACQTLYQKPELLNDLSSQSKTTELKAYLALDRYTLLPISSGIKYGGLYTVEGLPYQLDYEAEQSYTIASNDALPKINEAAGQ